MLRKSEAVFRLLVATAETLVGAANASCICELVNRKAKADRLQPTFKMYRSTWGKGLLSKCTGLHGGRGYFQNVQVYIGEGVTFKMCQSRCR